MAVVGRCVGLGLMVVGVTLGALDIETVRRTAADARGNGQGFTLMVEQNGIVQTGEGAMEMTLRRAPFVLWVVYTGTPKLLINVSAVSTLHDTIVTGEDPRTTMGEDFDLIMGGAEYSYNLGHEMWLGTMVAHYLLAPDVDRYATTGPSDQTPIRFNRAVWDTEFFAGGRDVAVLIDTEASPSTAYRIDELPYDVIYVSGMQTRRGPDYESILIEGRSLALRFE